MGRGSNKSAHSSEGDRAPLPAPGDVYTRVASHLGPGLAGLGYVVGAGRGFPWWFSPDRGGRLFISCQVDAKATDPFAGSGLRLELERGVEGTVPNARLAGRALFFQLLTDEELKSLLDVQNELIASLPAPPETHVNSYPEFLRVQYLSYFQPQDTFDPVKSWLRYRALDDVDRWLELLVPVLPVLDRRARASLKSDEMYLGRGHISIGPS
jgi:hypothetical protein